MVSSDEFLVKTASSSASLDSMLSEIAKINRDKRFVVQVFDPKRIINRAHVFGAYIDSVESFKEKTNITKSRSLEMLLFVAMTNQISDAIKTAGAKTSKEFVLFANSREAFNGVKHLLKSTKDFSRNKKEQQPIASKFGIYAKEDLDKFILQKMAVSRLSD